MNPHALPVPLPQPRRPWHPLALSLGMVAALGGAAALHAQTARDDTTRDAASRAGRAGDYIVAIVNTEPVTNHEVLSRAARLAQQMGQQGLRPPPAEELLREALEMLVNERAQLQLARESGIRIDDAALQQAEETVAQQNQTDLAGLRRVLEQQGFSPTQYREELRNELTILRLREREVDARVRVSDLEIDQFIAEQQASQDPGALDLNLAQVLIAVPEGAPPAEVAQRRVRAEAVLARARKGDDFEALARELSDAPQARESGGIMGLRPADRYPQLFLDAVRSVDVGGLSAVVQSDAGFHVLKVLERRVAGVGADKVVQQRARHILLRPSNQMNEANARRTLADLRQRIVNGTADFAQLAREYSQDGSARAGGDLGWVNPGVFVPEFERVLSDLKPGELSEPVVSRFGMHLIQLLERREATLSQREQRDMARGAARQKKLDEAYRNWVQEVRSRAYVNVREAPSPR